MMHISLEQLQRWRQIVEAEVDGESSFKGDLVDVLRELRATEQDYLRWEAKQSAKAQ